MSGLTAIAGPLAGDVDRSAISGLLDKSGSFNSHALGSSDVLIATAQPARAPGPPNRIFETESISAAYAGDIVNHEDLDWSAIAASLRGGLPDSTAITSLRGAFALTVFDKKDQKLHIITDAFAWLPVYFMQAADSLAVSTSLGTFLNLPSPAPAIDRHWMHQFLYFNYPIGATSPLMGVARIGPGSVMSFDVQNSKLGISGYRDFLSRPAEFVAGREAQARAINVFRNVVPRYFPDDQSSTVGLSAGLDSRTILASLPEEKLDRLHSFTYGIAGSSEITECETIAASLNTNHKSVPLGADFRQNMASLARDTVFLSDGLQNVNRSHLLFVYRQLSAEDVPFSTLTTGVSGDHVFRDHIRGTGNLPHMMNAEIASLHRLGRQPIDYTALSNIFVADADRLAESIEPALDEIEESCGEFGDPQSYLRFLMYVIGPRYFSGEAAIANSVATFRNPFWDPDIVELGFQLRDATLGASQFLQTKDKFSEARIQAAVIAAHKRVSRIPYLELRIGTIARGNRAAYELQRVKRRIATMIQRRNFVYGEDWSRWYEESMQHEIARLLGADSRIRRYVRDDWIEKSIATSDVHWLGKLITAEHVLRLIEDRWLRIEP